MTKGEYWILDVVLEWRDTIVALEPDDIEMLQMAFNRKWHGLPHAELLDTLDSLFRRGNLIAQREDWPEHSWSGLYTPSRKEIKAALLGRAQGLIYYGLTAQGGKGWETVSRPDWNRYLNRCGSQDEDDLDCQEMESSNRVLIEAYLGRESRLGRVLADTIKWEEFAPWKATYWKTLPRGYRVRYRCPDGVDSGIHDAPVWYTNYFDAQIRFIPKTNREP